MHQDPVERLVRVGFSEYEAKAYVALLRKSPVSGYELSKMSGVPRSMIYEVVGKLSGRGAAMTLRVGDATKYAPVPAVEFLDQIQREHNELISGLKNDLTEMAASPELEYVWNIEGRSNIIARAIELICQSERLIYLALLPETFRDLQMALKDALKRGVKVVIYTTEDLPLPGSKIAVARVSHEALAGSPGLGLILVIDGAEVLIAEWSEGSEAQGSWTSSPLLVFIAEHHLRTDLYLPEILTLLDEKALSVIQEEDRELFAKAFESRIDKS